MKELSIQEKAKRYDEALKVLHKYDGANIMFSQSLKEEMFPELKESEDEKIRKSLIILLQHFCKGYRVPGLEFSVSFKDMLAWLEKQGKKMSDPRYGILDKLIEADDIYQMSVNDAMVEEAKSKAIEALSKLEISKLLELEKQGEHANFLDKIQIGDKVTRNEDGMLVNLSQLQRVAKPADVRTIGYWHVEDVEQKPADKVEPKFHEGDWVVSPNGVYWHIDKISNNRYEVTSSTGESSDWNLDTNIYHRFTIQEIKNGDVLSYRDGQWIFIYKEKIDDSSFHYHALYSTIHQDLTIDDSAFTLLGDAIVPATNEERDTLMKAMADAGYTFDFVKKELKKIEQKPVEWSEEDDILLNDAIYTIKEGERFENKLKHENCHNSHTYQVIISWLKSLKERYNHNQSKSEVRNIEQKPAWSEEDEYYYGIVQYILNNECVGKADRENAITWYNFLKDRVQPQPKQEWSEEDEKCCSIVIAEFSKCAGKSVSKDEWMRCNDWLNSLRDRVQPKQEWNEEDEDMLYKATAVINRLCAEGKEYVWSIKTLKKLFFWLKSLRPQSHWKPSDEQIKAIKWVMDGDNPENWSITLKNLYQNLKKLKG